MKLIVGLGNPSSKYLQTRHNIGFICIDTLAQIFGETAFKSNHKSHISKVSIEGQPCLLVKPQTYMNLSGEAVSCIMNYYKINIDDLIVIHDDIDLNFGEIRFQKSRGHGGNNGVRNIHDQLGTKGYARLKMGVGNPNRKMDSADYVLQKFNNKEIASLMNWMEHNVDALSFYVKNGLKAAANEFNKKDKQWVSSVEL